MTNEKKETTRPELEVTHQDRVSYHMAEFSALKSEISELVRQTNAYIVYAFAASAGTIAWLMTNPATPDLLKLTRWLPLSISGLLGLLSGASYLRIDTKYILKLETLFRANHLGWDREINSRPRLICTFHVVLWGALNSAGIYAALMIPFPTR